MMEYSKLIEALTTNFVAAGSIKVLQPLTVENFSDVENILLRSHGGQISYLKAGKREWVNPGELLFIPSGKPVTITHGHTDAISITQDYCLNNGWKYLQATPRPAYQTPFESFSYLSFDARVLEAINLFSSLTIPVLVIRDSNKLSTLFNNILAENALRAAGVDRVLAISTELLIIELLRYMHNSHMLQRQLDLYHAYFKDTRLIKIISYIRKNLDRDLSNRNLAATANISEDYMGQYFKLLAGVSPQGYVETQRMERAIRLLRTTSKSISEIAKTVGFKDTAYFCRRFKLRLGVQPRKLRACVG